MRELLSILDLERVEEGRFRGRSPQVGWQRVFGGQVIGQALHRLVGEEGAVGGPGLLPVRHPPPADLR